MKDDHKYQSTIHFIDTDFGKCFYFKSTLFQNTQSSKELIVSDIDDITLIEMIRERQRHFDRECLVLRDRRNSN